MSLVELEDGLMASLAKLLATFVAVDALFILCEVLIVVGVIALGALAFVLLCQKLLDR